MSLHHGWQWPLGGGAWLAAAGRPSQRRGTGEKKLVQACPDMGVKWVTVYAFSTENWKRSTEEVIGLMRIFARYIEKEAGTLSKEGCGCALSGIVASLMPSCAN